MNFVFTVCDNARSRSLSRLAGTAHHRPLGRFPIPPPSRAAPRKSNALFSMPLSSWIAVSACFFPCRFQASTNCPSKKKSITSAGNEDRARRSLPQARQCGNLRLWRAVRRTVFIAQRQKQPLAVLFRRSAEFERQRTLFIGPVAHRPLDHGIQVLGHVLCRLPTLGNQALWRQGFDGTFCLPFLCCLIPACRAAEKQQHHQSH